MFFFFFFFFSRPGFRKISAYIHMSTVDIRYSFYAVYFYFYVLPSQRLKAK